MSGLLYVCATPIGNLEDATPRLRSALAAADVVYSEDTRRGGKLLQHFGLSKPLRSYFSGNESERSAELAARIAAGETVAFITDAGTPAVSDPGLSAVAAAVAAGGKVVPIPGPSAVTTLLAASGLPADRFVFEGFLPRKGGERGRRLAGIAAETRTVVFFTTAPRMTADLEDLAAAGAAGDRRLVVGRELSKLHEEIWRGTLAEAQRHTFERRGEFTVAIAGGAPPTVDLEEAVERARAAMAEGMSTRDAAASLAEETGLSRRQIYERLI